MFDNISNTVMAAITTPVENNSLYKCGKKSQKPQQLGKLCQWWESPFDYPAHLKEVHPESCFKNGTKKAFHWNKGNNISSLDKGLIEHRLKPFVYEIYYNQDSNGASWKFSLTANLKEDSKCYYTLSLQNESWGSYEIKQLINPNFSYLLKDLTERHYIEISQNILHEYSDWLGRLKFKITLHE